MKGPLRWTLVALFFAGILAFLAWAFIEGQADVEMDPDLQGSAGAPQRVSRSAAGDVVVSLDPESQDRMGLKVMTLEVCKVPREKTGYARVLEPDSLVTLQDELVSAEARLTAARAEQDRAKALYESVKGITRSSMEVVEAEFVSRENRARAAKRRLINAWGEGIASLSNPERESLLDRLVKRQAALARVDLPAGESLEDRPTGGALAPLGPAGPRLNAERIFEAPQIDPKLQGQGFLLLFESPSPALRPGAVMAAYLLFPGDPREGVLIPRSSVIRFEGLAWVYVRGAPEKFFRREVTLDQVLEKGLFTAYGFAAGDQVVVTGAEGLLAEELRHQIQLKEE